MKAHIGSVFFIETSANVSHIAAFPAPTACKHKVCCVCIVE